MSDIKKNAIYNTIKTVLGVILPLLTFPYVSRTLLPSNLGKYNWSVSFVEFFSLIASLGISTYAIRACSSIRDDRKKLDDVASQIFSINLVTTATSYIVLIALVLLVKRIEIYKLSVLIQSLTIVLTTFGVDWVNQAMEDFKYISLRTIACQILYLIGIFVFIKGPEDYIKYVILSLVTNSGCYIVNIFYVRRYCNIHFTLNIDWLEHLRPIIQLFIMQLAQVVISSTGITMLGLIRSDYEVGIYSFAVSLLNMITQIPTSILWVLLPRLSYLFSKNDYESANELLSDVFGFFMLLGLPCITGVIMLSKEIVLVFPGEAYLDSVPAIIILMIGFLLSLVGDAFYGNMVLLPSGKEKKYMYINLIAALFVVISNPFLIMKIGYLGVALVDLLTNALVTVLMLAYKDKRVIIDSKFERIAVPILGCLLIVIVCLFGKKLIVSDLMRMIICIPLSVIVYFAIMFIFKNKAFTSIFNDSFVLSKKSKN